MVRVISLVKSKVRNSGQENSNGWIPRHGALEQLHSNQGTNLTCNSKTIEAICKELEVLKGYVHTVDTQTCYMARFGNTAGVARF